MSEVCVTGGSGGSGTRVLFLLLRICIRVCVRIRTVISFPVPRKVKEVGTVTVQISKRKGKSDSSPVFLERKVQVFLHTLISKQETLLNIFPPPFPKRRGCL